MERISQTRGMLAASLRSEWVSAKSDLGKSSGDSINLARTARTKVSPTRQMFLRKKRIKMMNTEIRYLRAMAITT